MSVTTPEMLACILTPSFFSAMSADPLVFCGTCPAAGAAPRPQEALLPLPGLQSRADRPGRLRPDEDRLPQVRGDLLTENLNYGRGPLMEGLHKEEGSAEFVLPSFI